MRSGARVSARVVVKVEGLQDVLAQLRGMDKAMKEPIRLALKAKFAQVAAEAKSITPDDPETPGGLRDSVRAVNPTISRTTGKITAGIVAGGKALNRKGRSTAEAIVQHEDLTLHHPHGGEPKFLEKPFFRHVEEYGDVVVDAIDSLNLGTV
jgi:hypothetical protein